jgi:hypothetical protein
MHCNMICQVFYLKAQESSPGGALSEIKIGCFGRADTVRPEVSTEIANQGTPLLV